MDPRTALAVHADWSIDPAKRWMCVATPHQGRWLVGAPEPVGDCGTLFDRLRARTGGAPVAFGIDCPLGLPRAYAARRHEPNFPAFLLGLAETPGFFTVAANLDSISIDAPFYPARGVRGMTRLAHAQALGLASATELCRHCDQATCERPAGAPVFWTLGANQSGKAAIAAWRDLLLPALPELAVRLWPFDGPLLSLLAPGAIAIAETYPAEAMRHLGLRQHGSKRRQADRAAHTPAMVAAMGVLGASATPALHTSMSDGFGSKPNGEDQFDSVLGVLCVLGVLAGLRPDRSPADPSILTWEGWVLGQTALPKTLAG
jgi:hypothetical protein